MREPHAAQGQSRPPNPRSSAHFRAGTGYAQSQSKRGRHRATEEPQEGRPRTDLNFVAGTQTPTWTDKVHRGNGNVLLSDGSAQQLTSARLRDLLRNTGDTSGAPGSPGPNTILFPN
jgi:hypothetical protein